MGTEEALRSTTTISLDPRDTQYPGNTPRHIPDSFRRACLRSFAACIRPEGVNPNTPGKERPAPLDLLTLLTSSRPARLQNCSTTPSL